MIPARVLLNIIMSVSKVKPGNNPGHIDDCYQVTLRVGTLLSKRMADRDTISYASRGMCVIVDK